MRRARIGCVENDYVKVTVMYSAEVEKPSKRGRLISVDSNSSSFL